MEEKIMERLSGCIQTFSGIRFWPLDPRLEDIRIEDIAHALSMQCRFTGHTKLFWSVAEHSLLVAALVPPNLRLAALLHDASEAYLADVSRPLKTQPEFDFYRMAEKRLMGLIGERFGVDHEDFESCGQADKWALAIEARDLLNNLGHEWNKWMDQLPADLATNRITQTKDPNQAKDAFLEEYNVLMAASWDDPRGVR